MQPTEHMTKYDGEAARSESWYKRPRLGQHIRLVMGTADEDVILEFERRDVGGMAMEQGYALGLVICGQLPNLQH